MPKITQVERWIPKLFCENLGYLSTVFSVSLKKKKSEESRQTGKKRPKTLCCCHIKLQVNKFYSNHHLYVGRSGGVLNGEFLLSSVKQEEAPSWLGAPFQPVVLEIMSQVMEIWMLNNINRFWSIMQNHLDLEVSVQQPESKKGFRRGFRLRRRIKSVIQNKVTFKTLFFHLCG